MVNFPKIEVNAGCNLPKIVLVAGFPDNQTSGWGHVLPERLAKEYHLIMLCLPGFEDGGKVRPWGYDFDELIEGMHGTIAPLLAPNEKFTLLAHDWGGQLSYLYLEKYSSFVSKYITVDVGLLEMKNTPYSIFIYQAWFAIAFAFSQIFRTLLGTIVMVIIFLPGLRGFLPTRNENLPRKREHVHAGLCYPYYYKYRNMIKGQYPKVIFPTVPTLYVVRIPLLLTYFLFNMT
jgi:pimeloyl-ACP methyl ester carboxylesterase